MNINNLIKRVDASYNQYVSHCGCVAKAAQKHIDWDDDIGCEYFPGDGVCLTTTDAHVCPASLFFATKKEKGEIDREDFVRICV